MALIIKQQGTIELTRHQKHQTAIKALRSGGRWTPVYESNCAISSPEVGSDDVGEDNVFMYVVVVACFVVFDLNGLTKACVRVFL